MNLNKVGVVGLGYIGLPTAALLASSGVEVIGYDVKDSVIESINNGKPHFFEPGLSKIIEKVVREKKLEATRMLQVCDAYIIAVPTPFKESHEPDLSYVEAACEAIAPFLTQDTLVLLESTSPVGTTEGLAKHLARLRPDLTFPSPNTEQPVGAKSVKIAYCPERVLPGNALAELVANERVVGGITKQCALEAAKLYKKFVSGACYLTDSRTAEMCKLVENSFRDVNIAFANELSMLSESLGVNVWELINLANKHPRVNILTPGPGVGGHCIAVDPWFLVKANEEKSKLIECARRVNDSKPEWVIEKFNNAINMLKKEGGATSGAPIKVGVYGITFKADIEDLRESPSLWILEKISKDKNIQFKVIEPNISEGLGNWGDNVELSSIENAINDCRLHLVLVKHKQFTSARFQSIEKERLIDVVGLT